MSYLAAFVGISGLFSLGIGAAARAETDCTVHLAQYSALSMQMTYAAAVKTLGCDGVEISSSEMAGFKTVMLQWKGAHAGANMNAMFQNGHLITKAQFGLD